MSNFPFKLVNQRKLDYVLPHFNFVSYLVSLTITAKTITSLCAGFSERMVHVFYLFQFVLVINLCGLLVSV